MLRLTAAPKNPLRLIGSGFGSGERLIAAESRREIRCSVGDFSRSAGCGTDPGLPAGSNRKPTPETHCGADQAELSMQQSR